VAREKDANHAISVAKKHAESLGELTEHTIAIDPTIIGGLIIEKNGKRIDHSYKRALLDAYRRITR
jgi:F0F1-type ATP synthase delta subunit